jgi:hypothetical protein
MSTLSICVRNWYLRWAYESGTGACNEHTRQLLMRAQSAVSSKHAEHTGQERMRNLRIQVRNGCVPWPYRSGTDAYPEHMGQEAYPEHTRQFLTHMLSISVKIPYLKRSLQHMLSKSMRVRKWCVHWAYAYWCAHSACASEIKCA